MNIRAHVHVCSAHTPLSQWRNTRTGDEAALQAVYSRQVAYALYVPLAAFIPTLSTLLPPGLGELLELLAEQYQAAERRPGAVSMQAVSQPIVTVPHQPMHPSLSNSALPLSSLLASQVTAAVQSPLLSTSPLGLSSPSATPPTAMRHRTLSMSADATHSAPLVDLLLDDADSDEVIGEYLHSVPLLPTSPAHAAPSTPSSAALMSAPGGSGGFLARTRGWYDTADWSAAADNAEEQASASTPEEAAGLQQLAQLFPFRRQVHSWRAHMGSLRTVLPQV